MPSLKDIVAKAHGMAPTPGAGQDQLLPDYYAPRWRAWLSDDNRQYSEGAIAHCIAAHQGRYQHERSRRISPSSLGADCEREILFSYGGAPKLPPDPKAADVMESGTHEHIRWQMAGLTVGWLKDVEVWAHSEELMCGGSIDGIGDDGSLWEFKNTADHLYGPIVTGRGSAKAYAIGMVHKHKVQMACYKILDEVTKTNRLSDVASLVYQNRATKDVYEVRFRYSERHFAEAHAILEGLHNWIDLDQLPDMLDGCWAAVTPGEVPDAKEITKYRRCPYREYCPTAQTVTVT